MAKQQVRANTGFFSFNTQVKDANAMGNSGVWAGRGVFLKVLWDCNLSYIWHLGLGAHQYIL